jgi:hypothetical protein
MKLQLVLAGVAIALFGPSPHAHGQPGLADPFAPAQPTHDRPAAFDAFLEQRVTEELAADGQVLSRLGVSLDIELIGDTALVSLIDLATGRAAASTKLDGLPADRDAAVASVIQIVANLTAQLAGRAPAPTVTIVDDRAERDRRLAAEEQFKNGAIGFGSDYTFMLSQTPNLTTVSMTRRWHATQGPLRIQLEPETFYTLVERPDLRAAFKTRRWIRYGAYGACVVGLVGAMAIAQHAEQLPERDQGPWKAPFAASLVAMSAGFFVALYLELRPHPISENEAKVLAHEHNQKLRRGLGLPTARRSQARGLKLAWTPYATENGGGLVLGGRF